MNGLSSLEQPRTAQRAPFPFGLSLQSQFVRTSPVESSFHLIPRSFLKQILSKTSVLEPLQTTYVVDDRRDVAAFVADNQLSDFLLRSVGPIDKAFGSGIKILRLLHDEEGTTILFCYVTFSGTLENAEKALASFDTNWWLANVRRYGTKLNFDFELV